ncbi:MAG: hypothetical protein NE328_18015 [Lentisphaeraceae bacterium]|nr:hypothetical protein [Lentisphaeraceae bacterium]
MSFIFNSVGSILKKAAEAAERSNTHQKKPQRRSPLGGESPEDFFARMQAEQSKPAKKLRLNPQHQESNPEPVYAIKKEPAYEFKAPDRDNVESIPTTTIKSTKVLHRVNAKDKKALRKAIVINEVLGRPKAFKH